MGTRRNDTLEQGSNGGRILNVGEGALTDVDYGGLLVVEAAVLTSWTCNLDNSADLVGVTLPAGIYIPAQISAINVASGTIIAYNDYE